MSRFWIEKGAWKHREQTFFSAIDFLAQVHKVFHGASKPPSQPMQNLDMVRMLHLAFTRYTRDVRNRTARWAAPKPWQTTRQSIYDGVFVSMGLPGMSGRPTLTGAHDDTCMHSGAVFGSLVA